MRKVSVIMLNYNSSKIIDIVKESIRNVVDMDYPDYEFIFVDNASTDRSFEELKEYIERVRGSTRVKIIRNKKNLGFTGGMNVGYRARDPDSKYVVLLNNDAVPETDSLRNLVECIESYRDRNVGAVQGIIMDYDTGRIDTAGDMLSELLVAYQMFHDRLPSEVPSSFYVSYVDGAYCLFDIDSLKRVIGRPDKMFEEAGFGYFDDSFLGLLFWNKGYRMLSCPVVTARHRRSSTFGKVTSISTYLQTRGYFALLEMSDSKYRGLVKTMFMRRLLSSTIVYTYMKVSKKYQIGSIKETIKYLWKGYRDGVRLGKLMTRKYGRQSIYRMPILRNERKELVINLLTGYGTEYFRRAYTETMTREFEKTMKMYRAD